ncbi:MAG: regulatory iron-sulfur-containing complex subunit RicT [Bacteroidia bacterium]
MGCSGCASGKDDLPTGCKNNGWCSTGGCGKLDTYDWLSNITTFDDQRINAGFVEVKFKGTRKGFFKNVKLLNIEIGDAVVVDSPSGYDVGYVSLRGELVRLQMKKYNVDPDSPQFLTIQRIATEKDMEKYEAAKKAETRTMMESRKVAQELKLVMKISDVEYQGDFSKATFYYTADGRVDFRELIKVLARSFHVRIEMKQIGLRQEAGRLGGIGSCGRELCCSTWLTDFDSVSISAARYQNLFLNPLKLSGQCGRLKCCLNYELDTYLEALQEFPDDNTVLLTKKGKARIFKSDVLKKLIWFHYMDEDQLRTFPLTLETVKKIMEENSKKRFPEDLESLVFEEENLEEKELEFKDVVGEDSINRFDLQKSKKRSNPKKSRRKGKKPPPPKTQNRRNK